jgi:hypothetical protein
MNKASRKTGERYKSNIRIDEGKRIILNRLRRRVATENIVWQRADIRNKVMSRVAHDKFDKE